MTARIKYFFLLIVLATAVNCTAQQNVVTLGIQIKPIIPFKFFKSGIESLSDRIYTVEVEQKVGYSYGVVIRWGLTKMFSLETGINQTRRNFNVFNTDTDSSFTDQSDFGIINYEIPVQFLVYIKLSDRLYMNNSAGLSINMYPTDVTSRGIDRRFGHTSVKNGYFQPSLNANVGYEYRTREKGYFYLGASYHGPFFNIATSGFTYNHDLALYQAESKLYGSYLTIDFRYFFHEDPKKREKKKKK